MRCGSIKRLRKRKTSPSVSILIESECGAEGNAAVIDTPSEGSFQSLLSRNAVRKEIADFQQRCSVLVSILIESECGAEVRYLINTSRVHWRFQSLLSRNAVRKIVRDKSTPNEKGGFNPY